MMESMVINDTRKKVLLLYTGGTMGMVASQDGSLAPQAGYLTDRINELPEMSRPEMPIYHIKEYDPLMDSSCMGPKEWQMIATDIETNYLEYDGFVVIMGTDTMAYAASALSFMLENLGKTVVFTGSQIPFCEVYNDARRNLIVSIIFAISSDFPEVCICFNDKLLRANRAVKVNSVGLAAFDSPNFPPLATLGAFINENRELALPQPRGPFRAHKTLEAKVIVIKLVPGFDDECILALVTHSKALKALVLEMYGTGNGPSEKGGGMIYTYSMIDRMIMLLIMLLAALTKRFDCKKSFSSTKFEIHKDIKHKSSYKKSFVRS
jgi:L-asparaginase